MKYEKINLPACTQIERVYDKYYYFRYPWVASLQEGIGGLVNKIRIKNN